MIGKYDLKKLDSIKTINKTSYKQYTQLSIKYMALIDEYNINSIFDK